MEESTHTESQNLILNLIGEKLIIHHSAFDGALTFVSEPKLGHSALHFTFQ